MQTLITISPYLTLVAAAFVGNYAGTAIARAVIARKLRNKEIK